ncbi:MAG: hypothetical protein H6797_04295 [Candidatus Nomurabacteria bacterium]|nr:MAG: hypothetical protein H6797_04295 [Candidatus Nomurabacteria bacterium]
MHYNRNLSIEIFRDSETPDVQVDLAVTALEEIRQITKHIEIVERGNVLQLSEPGVDAVYTKDVPLHKIQTDFGIILSSRPLVLPTMLGQPPNTGNITVGNAWVGLDKPFAVIDAERTYSLKNSTKHEVGHFIGVPRKGKYFDGDCHCNRPNCVMHSMTKIEIEQDDYCHNCTAQLAKNAFNLMRLKK